MSIWMSASSSPNKKLASALDSSVLPTPDGPAKMNEPDGRLGSFSPARVRRIALETALTASSWPMIRLCTSSSMRSNRVVSASVSLNTGIPVQLPSTSAISLSSTSATTSISPERHCFSRSARWRNELLFAVAQAGRLLEVLGVDRGFLLPAGLGDLLVELTQVWRRGHPADPHPGAGLVDQVDRLVRQEPVVDVAVGQGGGGHDRADR